MISHSHDADPGDAPIPSFALIEHPSFPKWMLEGLDRLFAGEPRITRVHFDLWVNSYYDDNSNYEYKGSATFNTVAGTTEADLDEVPAVRMFERRGDEMWEVVPLSVEESESVSINGEYSFYAERGRILFEYNTHGELEHVLVIEARHGDGGWTYHDRIVLTCHEGSSSDLVANDAKAVLAVYSEGDLLLDEMPEPVSVVVEEDETVVVHLKPGELTRCMEKR